MYFSSNVFAVFLWTALVGLAVALSTENDKDHDPFRALRGIGRGGSLAHAVNEKNLDNWMKLRHSTDRKIGAYFSKRLLLAEQEEEEQEVMMMITTTTTLNTVIEDEIDVIIPFIQQSFDHIRHSILERNDHLNDSLALELAGNISKIRTMFNDDSGEERYRDYDDYDDDDDDRRLVATMIGVDDELLLLGTSKTILENMIKGLPPSALESDNNGWEVFVSTYILGVIMEGFQAATTSGRHVLAATTVQHGGTNVDVDVETLRTAIGDFFYMLWTFVFGPIVEVMLWMILAPYYSYCLFCGFNAEVPICHLATNANFCKNATTYA